MMKKRESTRIGARPDRKHILAIITAAFVVICSLSGCDTSIDKDVQDVQPPHLEKRGSVTQLIVQGKPWLVLGCELGNSTSSSREYMQSVWPKLKESGVNTVLAVVSWEQTEPTEGQFDGKAASHTHHAGHRNL